MTIANLDPTTLTTFQDAAAGHEGPMSDSTGTLFIKPCTQTEVTFYETANAHYPKLAEFLPTYYGTLSLSQNNAASSLPELAATVAAKAPDPIKDAISAKFGSSAGPLKGRKISTDLHIVLANATSGFTRANVLDCKLGSQLWDEDARPEKRARLDAVSEATTSGSLGFRIAGMRTWQGSGEGEISDAAKVAKDAGMGDVEKETNMFSYNKFYGRQFKKDDVLRGFRDFVMVPKTGIDVDLAIALTQAFLDGTKELEKIFKETEFRMFGGSILYSYEGDGKVFETKLKATEEAVQTTHAAIEQQHADCDEEDNDEDEDTHADKNILLTIKLIDFAHARFVPGNGPDQNILQGVQSIIRILEKLLEDLNQPVVKTHGE